ncbi:hypothetical protein QAD02_013041 [Eretmocerus hayati]|uniref:Uncharacterized protein n=1 Tax=Eretmocerus hayati TaxID=131215 RepID=A0ACC2P3Z1_9HYME|nr:hypothetical protein QAD02_013041 [Eretmocerus hayati]
MESLMEEIQNLNREFEEESKERKKCFEEVEDIADTLKKDLEVRTGEWDEKWNELKKGRKKEMPNKTELREGQEKTEGAECEKESMKRGIMINKKKLKGSEVYIDKDLTFKERSIRRKLEAVDREQVEKGKRATVRDDTLIIDGCLWEWSGKDQNIFQTGKKWEEKKNQGAGQ